MITVNNFLNKSWYFVLILLLSFPVLVSAHTRWFAEGEITPLVTIEPTELYLFICTLIGLLIIGVGILMEKKKKLRLAWLKPKAPHAFSRASATFTMVAGAFFMIAGSHEYLFSPNLTHESGIPMSLIVIQFCIGLLFLVGVYARIAALALGFLWFITVPFAGLEAALEDIWVLSIIFFIVVMGADYFSILAVKGVKPMVYKWRQYAIPVLRVGTGITLMVLGFSEKILRPELGLNFLAQHDWNFLSGFGVSNYLFVFMAGSTEILLGIFFVLGIMTRVTALVTAVIFTLPLFLLGPIELAGHLPHFVAVFILLLFGAGAHFRLIKRKGGE